MVLAEVALGARIWVAEVGASPHAPGFSSRPSAGPWNDFGMCLCVGTVIVGVLIRPMRQAPRVSFSTLLW